MKYLSLTTLILLAPLSIAMKPANPLQQVDGTWAQKILKSLSLQEKIGQLFMVATVSDPTYTSPGKDNDRFLKHCPYKTDHAYIKKLIQKYHVGGIIFLGYGTPETQKTVTDNFQQLSKKIPLLIGQDCEWGLSMRLDKTMQFPRNMTLGAIQDNDLIYQLGKEIGRQCALLGIHINFAPVVDINTNPKNPIINDRSFGEDKKLVGQKAVAYMQGLHAGGVLACAKHFPGHGNTTTDSHIELPLITENKKRLNNVELHPFKELINSGIGIVMAAHLAVPSLEKNINCPATLSEKIITNVLKKELNFNGIVVTDGLGMQGVTKNFAPGHLELQALFAGNHILLCPMDVPKATTLIAHAIKQKQFSEQELDKRVLNILRAKEWALTEQKKIIDHDAPLSEKLNTMYGRVLKHELYKKAITLVRDNKKMIPINTQKTMSVLLIGSKQITPFAQELQQNMELQLHYTSYNPTLKETDYLLDRLTYAQSVIVALHGMTRFAKENYGITSNIINLIKALCNHASVAITIFGNPYSLEHFAQVPTVICAYENDNDAQTNAAKILLGNIKAEGKLPISLLSL